MDWKEFFMPSWKKFWIVTGLFLISKISLYIVFFLFYFSHSHLGLYILIDIFGYLFSFLYYILNPFAFVSNFLLHGLLYDFFFDNKLSYPIIIFYHYLLACIITYFFVERIKNFTSIFFSDKKSESDEDTKK